MAMRILFSGRINNRSVMTLSPTPAARLPNSRSTARSFPNPNPPAARPRCADGNPGPETIMQIPPTSSIGTDISGLNDLDSQLLSQGDFLKLLIAQMTSQDPINPLSNQDMLTQMVQFSTLQQNTGMQSELARMQSSQSLLQANALLGREVSLQVNA